MNLELSIANWKREIEEGENGPGQPGTSRGCRKCETTETRCGKSVRCGGRTSLSTSGNSANVLRGLEVDAEAVRTEVLKALDPNFIPNDSAKEEGEQPSQPQGGDLQPR